MTNQLIKLQLQYANGKYYAPVKISIEEWEELLLNNTIFDNYSLEIITDWYNQPLHQATSKEIMLQRGITGKSPFNGWVCGLGKRIIKYLQRFEVLGINTKNTYFIIPFEGWHVDYDSSKPFVWKIRDELIIALENLHIVSRDSYVSKTGIDEESENIESFVYKEGKKIGYYSTKYERNSKLRNLAIKIHGTKCQICGFDFEKTYGLLGKDFIEVHHIKPLYLTKGEIEIDPKADLMCLCSNCHRIIHRNRHDILDPTKLKKIVENNK